MSDGPAPYLSIVYTGRNDNFGGDFNERFFRAVRFNHERLAAAGLAYEIVFVEWRPVAGKPLLGDLLRAEVPGVDALLTTIEIDARYHDAFSQNPRIQFQEFIAKNVAIRRARGSYILATNSDIYLTRNTVAFIAQRVLRPMVLYRATRVDLKANLDPSAIDERVLVDARNHDRVNELKGPAFTNAAGDFLLLDRFTCHALRGFNEVFRVAKIHIDANFCHNALACGVLVLDTGTRVYHFGEGTFQAQRPLYRVDGADAPWGRQWHKSVRYRNAPGWGLGDAPAVARGPRHVRIEFDSTALPPIVDLAGIGADAREAYRSV
jgi:hypothetical protein